MIKQKLQEDQIAALKAKDSVRLSTLRYILSQIKNREIEKQTELSEEETVAILRKQAKELRESIDAFTKGGRTELVTEYQQQLDILSAYLPQEISDEELQAEVHKIKEANAALAAENPKALIGIAIKQLKEKANPQRIMKALQETT